jgi:bacillopeptidase F
MKPDKTNNTVSSSVYRKTGVKIDIRFADDVSWRTAINSVFVNDTELSSDQYKIRRGKIRIYTGVFTAASDYEITVRADGYEDGNVSQTIVGEKNKKSK